MKIQVTVASNTSFSYNIPDNVESLDKRAIAKIRENIIQKSFDNDGDEPVLIIKAEDENGRDIEILMD